MLSFCCLHIFEDVVGDQDGRHLLLETVGEIEHRRQHGVVCGLGLGSCFEGLLFLVGSAGVVHGRQLDLVSIKQTPRNQIVKVIFEFFEERRFAPLFHIYEFRGYALLTYLKLFISKSLHLADYNWKFKL